MRIKAIVIRIIQQFFRDKRTLALMIVAPMFVLFLMDLIFAGDDYVPTIAVDQSVPELLVEALEEQDVIVVSRSAEEATVNFSNQEIDAFLSMEQMQLKITIEGSDPSISKSVLMKFQKAAQKMQASSSEAQVDYLYGDENMNIFDNFGAVLIGFFIFFFVFLISGVSFLRERTSGTLERLLATPIRRFEIVFGYVIGFGIFTTFQASLISWFAIKVLGIMMEGSFLFVLLITFLLAMTALTLGTFLSAFANNELQMMQFIPIIIVPQFLFSGIFKLDSMADWLSTFSKFLPLTHGAEALKDIMIRGKGWEAISQSVFILVLFSLSFMVLNIFALKKYRKL